jgi:hypothetical protein
MNPSLIIAAVSAASTLIAELTKIIEERRQLKELTPEQEAEWDAYVQRRMQEPHWQPSNAP